MMPFYNVRPASVAHPFGDERAVQQAFPGAINEKEADPFLMCDYFNLPSSGPVSHPDDFPVVSLLVINLLHNFPKHTKRLQTQNMTK
jgi:hypothetical protein